MNSDKSLVGLVLALLGVGGYGCDSTQTSPDPSQSGGEPSVSVERGEQLFETLRCPQCHGADARGLTVFPFGPSIVGRSAEDLRRKIVDDCGTSTLLCHPLIIKDIEDRDLEDLSAFLGTLGGGNTIEVPGPVCDDVPGTICTMAGNGVQGNRGGTLLARDQYVFWPQNVTQDTLGRVVITDWNNYLVRRVESTGCRTIVDQNGNSGEDCPITNIIGTGTLGDSCSTPANRVTATDASLNHIVGITYDALIEGQSNIILWGWHNYKIYYIGVDDNGDTGEFFCLFGNGPGATADDLPAGFNFDGLGGPTRFDLPTGAVHDNDGNFYVSEQGNLRIRKIVSDDDDDRGSPERLVDTFANNLVTTFAGGLRDSVGNFRATATDYSDSGDGGPASEATFRADSGLSAGPEFRLAIDRDRNLLYLADSGNNRIRVMDLNEDPPSVDTFAGGGNDLEANEVLATEAQLNTPFDVDVATDGSGDVLITDTLNNCVRLVDFETRLIRTVAGICGEPAGYDDSDGIDATEALLSAPGGSFLAADGTVYIADTDNNRVRRVNPL